MSKKEKGGMRCLNCNYNSHLIHIKPTGFVMDILKREKYVVAISKYGF